MASSASEEANERSSFINIKINKTIQMDSHVLIKSKRIVVPRKS